MSVRPLEGESADCGAGDLAALGDSDEEMERELEGESVERFGLQKEEEFIRKLVDPKLPTQRGTRRA